MQKKRKEIFYCMQNKLLVLFLLITFSGYSADFYWVGNNTQWSDVQSWSNTSGGNPIGAIPGTNDKVIFDGNGGNAHLLSSFSIKELIITNAYQGELFASPASTIHIENNFTSEQSLSSNFQTTLIFHNQQSQIFSDFLGKANIYLQSGNLIVQPNSELKTYGNVILGSGTFSLDHAVLSAANIENRNEGPLNINLNASLMVATEGFDFSKSNQCTVSDSQSKIIISSWVPTSKIKPGMHTYSDLTHFDRSVVACGSFDFDLIVTSDFNGSQISCCGANDGEVCVDFQAGSHPGPYTYSWINPGSNPTTNQCATNLGAGTYSLVVVNNTTGDACYDEVDVSEPSCPSVFNFNTTEPTCDGVCDGTGSFVPVGGTSTGPASYTYDWNDGLSNEENTQNADELCEGPNSLTITDLNGCTFDTVVVVNAPPALFANITLTDASCFGVCDGSAVSNPSGGDGGPYGFSWTNGSTVDSAVNLCDGTYTLTLTDGIGCSLDTTFTINEPLALTINVINTVDLVCFQQCIGEIEVDVQNGTLPYTYEWFETSNPGTPLAGQTTEIATGLCAGTYFVVVTDANGCQQTSANINITEPTEIIPNVTNTNVDCFGECTATANGSASGGTPNYTFTWTDGSNTIGTGNSINALCAGSYFLEVEDANGCIVTSPQFDVTEPTDITNTLTTQDVLCAGQCTGEAEVVPAGGTVAGSYTVEWHSSNGGASTGIISTGAATTITGLCAGEYFAVIIDDLGCDDTTVVFNIIEPLPIDIQFTANDASCFGECDGSVDATISGGTGVLTYQWFDCTTNNPLAGETNEDISGLCPGSYYVEVTDDNACVSNNSGNCAVINEPVDIIISLDNTTDASCGGSCDGSATASVSGGAGGETIVWYDASNDTQVGTGTTINNLCNGVYYAVATDVNGCDDSTANFNINDNVLVTGVVTPSDATCNGFCDGSASVVAAGGVPPYTYEWINNTSGLTISGPGPLNSINGLCAGDYTVQIFDDNGCASAPIIFTINENAAITVDAVMTDITCFGACDGAIDLTMNGGTAPFSFVWSPAPGAGQGSANVSQLCAAAYTVTITDNDGCTMDTTLTLADPDPFVFTVSTTDEVCENDCNGTADITPISGGTGAISYTWVPAPATGQGTPNVTGLCPGNYTVTMQDQAGCDSVITVTINAANPFTLNMNVTTDNDCNGDCDGVIQATVNGGAGGETFTWTPNVTGQGTNTATNLCAGTYDLEVQDANGCILNGSETITEPNAYDITTSQTTLDCAGDCNASITVTVNSGGTPNYSFDWNDPLSQSTSTASGLCAGTYDVIISDLNGCDSVMSFTITEPTALDATIAVTNNTCFGACAGEATATVTGGTGNTTVEWFAVGGASAGPNGTSITGLCAGDYFAVVTDDNGCTFTTPNFTIAEDPAILLAATTTQSNCILCDGSATVSASGGSGTFVDFQWSPVPGSGQGTATASNMCAGVYTVIVTDDNGCTEQLVVTISDVIGETVTADSTDVLCFGDCNGTATATFICNDPPCQQAWFDGNGAPIGQTGTTATALCPDDYFVQVTNNSGCISVANTTVNDGNEILANSTFTEPQCNGDQTGTATVNPTGGSGNYTFTWNPVPLGGQGTNTATGLAAGNYTVDIEDDNGCVIQESFTLTDPPVLDVSTVSSTDISCFGILDGTATVIPSGGTGNYSVDWFECVTNNPLGISGQQATGLAAGSYYAVVTDDNGCAQQTICVDVVEPDQITGTLSGTDISCNGACDGSVSVAATGGNNNYDYEWFTGGSAIPNSDTDVLLNQCPGTYEVQITDLNGCVETISDVTISEPNALTVTVSGTDASCNGDCDGTAIATVNGGTPIYDYVWTTLPGGATGQGTDNVDGLCAGTYDLEVTDQNGCIGNAQVIIGEPSSISFNATVTDITCNGDNDGSITINPSGGSGSYQYSWQPGGETTPTISNLGPNTYTVFVQDGAGCSFDTTITLTEPTVITGTLTPTSSTCGNCDGSISASINGGYGGYTLVWSPAPGSGQGGTVAAQLCAGLYTLDVTDQGGCTVQFSQGVSDIGAETVTTSSTDASCFDNNDGTATATFVCADPTCTVEWFESPSGTSIGQTTTTATALAGGDYFVEVTNNSGCITVTPVTVNAPAELEANESLTNPDCSGNATGSITVTPSGGSGAGYTFVWAPAPGAGQGTGTATGLIAGTWCVTITDGDGCDSTFCFDLVDPNGISGTLSVSDAACNGDATGSIDATILGGALPYSIQWLDNSLTPIAGETNSTISNIPAGDYSVEITDANGCVVVLGPETVSEPTSLAATITGTDVFCNGDCDGEAEVTITGGTPNYTTNWFDASNNFIGQTTPLATGLCPDDYYAVIEDANGCQITTTTQTIAEPTALTLSLSSTDASCSGVCDGTAAAVVGGGVAPYNYNWEDSNGNPVAGGGGPNVSNLCADIYSLTVADDNGCTIGPDDITVDQPTVLSGNVFVNDASCNTADGSANIVAAGGTQPYTYQWFDAALTTLPGETNPDLQNIAAGTYFVEVTDAIGCTETFQADVSNVDGPVISLDNLTDVTCFGANDGTIDVTITGQSAPFDIVWNPGGMTQEDLTNLAAGTYTIEVTDAAGCINFDSYDILEADQIDATFNVVDATCGDCDGALTANGTGGTGTLVYTWTTGENGSSISSLCPGSYSVNITDDNGCVENIDAVVGNTGGPDDETIAIVEPSCNGLADGSITVNPLGGTQPYTFTWLHDGGNTNTASNLSAGTYFLQVTDANNCTRTVEVELTEPDPFTINDNINPPTCGACDGEATLIINGGTGPYNVVWSGGATGLSATNLCEGVEFIDITDANGCQDTVIVEINGDEAPIISLTLSDETCPSICDGSATSSLTGGTASFSYEWQDDSGNPIGQTTPDATGLCEGTYILQVTDGAGCVASQQVDIDGAEDIFFSNPTVFDAQCSGECSGEAFAVVNGGALPYTFSWTPAATGDNTNHISDACTGTYTVTATDQNGCVLTQDVFIDEPLPLALAVDSIRDALCADSDDGFIDITASGGTPGYTYSWVANGYTSNDEDIDSLFPMVYELTITDANGCTLIDSLAVDTMIVVLADAGPDTAFCFGDPLQIIGIGTGTTGLSYQWTDDQGNPVGIDSLLNEQLLPGVYTFYFEAFTGDCSDIDSMQVEIYDIPVVDAGADIDIIKGEVTDIGGSPTGPNGSTFSWSPFFEMNDSTLANPTVEPDTSTMYYVTVTSAEGCVGMDSILVNVFPDITFPNGFSPNGDGVNEFWEIDFIEEFPESVVQVYNRWGDLLFQSVGYVEKWDGTFNNKPLPVGTYYYVITLNHPLYPEPYTGPITILR